MSTKRKKLPIGIQHFADIRDPKQNYVYIDKTAIAYQLIDEQRYVFLSRPRRFGKSLFLDTLAEIFRGNKQHFEGLAISDKWDWSETFPVIDISFGSGSYKSIELINNEFIRIFKEQNRSHGLEVQYAGLTAARGSFIDLITDCYFRYNKKVVLLIDEYDKVILDNLATSDSTFAMEACDVMRNFYSAIKDCGKYLRFVFITGVSKFSKLNLFSGLNNINDITIDSQYATITGYTHHDLETCFDTYFEGIDMNQVKRWYNGYNYFGEPIYNPFDILLFLSNACKYSNYWWQTGNPSFLIELLKAGNYFIPDLETCTVSEEVLNAFEVEKIDLVALLWQTGYLTFANLRNSAQGIEYTMKVPNLEVQNSLNALFLNYLTDLNNQKVAKQIETRQGLLAKNIDTFKAQLISLFAAIPYTNYVNNTISNFEGYYASVVFTFLASLGFDVIAEDTTNTGRIDLTIKTDEAVFIVEFKVDMPAETALHQIKTKRYFDKYIQHQKPIYLIGIHFDSTIKNIQGFEYEVMNIHF